jgi:Cu/Zn superoxide dismutase
MRGATGLTMINRSFDQFIMATLGTAALIGTAAIDQGMAAGSELSYSCVLTGEQEAPPVSSSGLGGGSFIIDTDANTVSYRIVFTGLTAAETAAHIHGFTDPGAGAGVQHDLGLGNPKVGVWAYDEVDEGDILAGKAYVNVHSGAFPGGEIRGQIVPLNASLNGDQEVPPVTTTGSGWGTFTIDTDTNELSYYIQYFGLTANETAAHIHGTALHGSGGGVQHDLGVGNPKIGTWTYPESRELALISGQMYVNIHSGNFPAGEIRGQIVPIVVPIDGEQEVPPTAPSGAGVGLFAFDTESNELSCDIRFGGLTGAQTAAHIHGFAPPGESAGVLRDLGTGSPTVERWNYGADQEPGILEGLTYVNIHSATFPGGEIRGQIQGFYCPPATVDVASATITRPFQLAPSTPNPFATRTTVRFSIPEAMPVRLIVIDAQGRQVRKLLGGTLVAGEHPIGWDGRDDVGRPVASGVYHYVLETPTGRTARQVTLLK